MSSGNLSKGTVGILLVVLCASLVAGVALSRAASQDVTLTKLKAVQPLIAGDMGFVSFQLLNNSDATYQVAVVPADYTGLQPDAPKAVADTARTWVLEPGTSPAAIVMWTPPRPGYVTVALDVWKAAPSNEPNWEYAGRYSLDAKAHTADSPRLLVDAAHGKTTGTLDFQVLTELRNRGLRVGVLAQAWSAQNLRCNHVFWVHEPGADGPTFSSAELDAAKRFIGGGGAMVVAARTPGEGETNQELNRLLAEVGAGTRLAKKPLADDNVAPILAKLATEWQNELGVVWMGRPYPLIPGSGTEVILEVAEGEDHVPLAVMEQVDKGVVVVLGAPLLTGGDKALQHENGPFLQALAGWLAEHAAMCASEPNVVQSGH